MTNRYTVKPRYTVPRFTTNPDIPRAFPFPQIGLNKHNVNQTKPRFTADPDLPRMFPFPTLCGKSGFYCIKTTDKKLITNITLWARWTGYRPDYRVIVYIKPNKIPVQTSCHQDPWSGKILISRNVILFVLKFQSNKKLKQLSWLRRCL